jgi:hypothetical protein
MKKQTTILAALSLALFGSGLFLESCSSEKKEGTVTVTETVTETKVDAKSSLLNEVDKLFGFINSGLTIGSPMDKIAGIDKEAKEFTVDGKPVGNYNSTGENEAIEWSRFYSKIDSKPNELYEIRFWAADKSINGEVEIGGDQKQAKTIDLIAIAEKINTLTKVNYTKGKPGDFDENNFYWQAADYFCWLEPGGSDSFYVYIRKEKI